MKKIITAILVTTTVLSYSAVKKKKVSVDKEVKKVMKVVLIIAKNNFRDEEYLEPKRILSTAGIDVVTASSSLGTATGMLGATAKVDITIDNIKVEEYDGIIFVGGTGSTEYWDNPVAHKIAKDALKHNKVLAAICIAPVTLARAGVLKGKKATVFSSEIDELKKCGVTYTGKSVETDGKIITASGPQAAKLFGETIKSVLLGK